MSTKRIPLYPSPDLVALIEAGIQPGHGGRSNRIAGMMERYKQIIDDNSQMEKMFEVNEIEILLNLQHIRWEADPWLLDWATAPALFSDEEVVKIKLISFNSSELSALEEYLAINAQSPLNVEHGRR